MQARRPSQHRASGHYLDVVDVLGLVGVDGGLGLAVLGGVVLAVLGEGVLAVLLALG